MSTTVKQASSLGSVIRTYDDKNHGDYRMPPHRRDDSVDYMRVDASGTLEVLAACEKHTTRQQRSDMVNGLLAPCHHGIECVWRPRYDATRVKRPKA